MIQDRQRYLYEKKVFVIYVADITKIDTRQGSNGTLYQLASYLAFSTRDALRAHTQLPFIHINDLACSGHTDDGREYATCIIDGVVYVVKEKDPA